MKPKLFTKNTVAKPSMYTFKKRIIEVKIEVFEIRY